MPKIYRQTFPANVTTPCFAGNWSQGVVLSRNFSCPLGFYCPNIIPGNVSTLPSLCPATADCQFARLTTSACLPQGLYEPSLCEPGKYCPDYKTILPCPQGYFCPSGTYEPRKCSTLANCPQGTVSQSDATGIVIAVIIDVVLIIAYFVRKGILAMTKKAPRVTRTFSHVTNRENSNPQADTKNVDYQHQSIPMSQIRASAILPSSPRASIMTPENAAAPAKHSLELLVDAWKRGLGSSRTGIDFHFEQLGLQLKSGQEVLSGVSGTIRSSRMTAVMGPSGAGKTTFMNVLCGKVSRTKGCLFLNGTEAEMSEFRKIIGYVPQEDIMLRELTVREIVKYSAQTRLPRSWTTSEVDKFVDDLLKALELSHVAHVPIGDEVKRGISGGQRKRVNIAMEMAAIPMCMFLDEPTSGLDSTAALGVANILKEVANLGLTIVAVIHQPRIEIFRKFDDVLLIAKGGRTAYLGPTTSARGYFEKMGYIFDPTANEADLLMDILSGQGKNETKNYSPTELADHWDKYCKENGLRSGSIDNLAEVEAALTPAVNFKETMKEIVDARGALVVKQFFWSFQRYINQQVASISSLLIETIIGLCAGGLMGIASVGTSEMYWNIYIEPFTALSPSPVAYIIPLFSMLIGCSIALASGPAAVKVFSEERPVYWREASSGHSRFAYFWGKYLATLPRIALSSLHFSGLYQLLAMPMIPFSKQFLIMFLNFAGIYGGGSIVSMLVDRENAPLLSTILNLFAAVFCGYAPSLKDAKKWGVLFIWETSVNKWATEAFYTENIVPFYSHVYQVDQGASYFGFTLDRYAFDVGMMVVIGLVMQLIGFILMLVTHRSKQI